MDELAGHIGHLSMQKSGSHVVEHCIMQAPQLMSDRIVNELKNDPRLLQIIIHEYGNYVIQTVLRHCQVKIPPHPQPKEFHMQSLLKGCLISRVNGMLPLSKLSDRTLLHCGATCMGRGFSQRHT